jgi:hypothetical protein
LRTPKAFGAWLEVGDQRFNSSEIQRLYDAEDHPLREPEWPSARARTSSQPSRWASSEDNRRALSSLGSLRRVLTLIRLLYFDLADIG